MVQLTGNVQENRVFGQAAKSDGFKIYFGATNCELSIGEDCDLSGLEINFNRPGQRVQFHGKNVIRGQIHLTAPEVVVEIGARTKTNSYLWMNLAERGTKVIIAEDCLLASVRFRTSDSHKIFDIETGERINPPGNIQVDASVWIAEDVLLLRGTNIGRGSVVGARSLVNGELPAASLSVGTPARVVRRNIRWEM